MELQHEFTVPVPVDEAWRALLDIERVAPCMPGATVRSFDGETVDGSVKVRVGPMTVDYRGTAAFRERDESAHRLVLIASGKETRGQGTARATVTATLTGREDGTTNVSVATDLTVTGRPAQFGRGVMAEVGDKLIGRFADCVAKKLSGPEAAVPRPGGAAGAATSAGAAASGGAGEPAAQPAEGPAGTAGTAREDKAGNGPRHAAPSGTALSGAEPIDLLRTAGGPVARRAAAVAAVLAAAGGLFALLRRLRHRRRGPLGARGRSRCRRPGR